MGFASSTPPPPSGPTGAWNDVLTHGDQLDIASHVGPWALQATAKGGESLQAMSVPGRGYWRADTPAEFAPTGAYAYNNISTNRGGIVPAGGLVIDGFAIPAGTYVAQFRDFSSGDVYASGTNKIMFRGCRMRNGSRAPGFWNDSTANAQLFLMFCDAGGLGALDAQYNEVPFKIAGAPNSILFRNYISYTTTGIQITVSGCQVMENYVEKMTYYYGPGIPPGESTDKHLNGFTCNGGITSILMRRNVFFLQTPDDAGRNINQTDCISFFNDGAPYNGGGSNADGTLGYQITDNYVGGGVGISGGAVFYLGERQDGAAQGFVVTGNKLTTQWGTPTSINGGTPPVWGTLGSVWSNNTWKDGPNAGNTIGAP